MPPAYSQVTLEARGLVHSGDIEAATSCLLAATRREPKLELKLRTFAPVLRAVCERGDAATATTLQVRSARAGGPSQQGSRARPPYAGVDGCVGR